MLLKNKIRKAVGLDIGSHSIKAAELSWSKEKGVSRFVFDTERPRLNEAALVAGTNPEISSDDDKEEKAVLRDIVLQRAMDLVTAIRFYKKAK